MRRGILAMGLYNYGRLGRRREGGCGISRNSPSLHHYILGRSRAPMQAGMADWPRIRRRIYRLAPWRQARNANTKLVSTNVLRGVQHPDATRRFRLTRR